MLVVEINSLILFFFFNDTATTEIYTLSLHDALPISAVGVGLVLGSAPAQAQYPPPQSPQDQHCRQFAQANVFSEPNPKGDRKSTRLNSSHANISYAVFCLKKKI